MSARLRRLDLAALTGVALFGAACREPAPSRPADAAAQESWTSGACGTGQDSWCWGYPRPAGNKLNRLWASGPRDVWAVGDAGAILHFDGDHWASVLSGTGDSLVAIGGRGPGDAWAIGKNRTLLRLSGGAWKAVEMPKIENEEQLADLLVLPNGEAWIVGGTTKSSLVGEELTSLCFVGHYDGAAWRFDEDEDCGPLGRVWGAAPDNVWADGADVVLLERALSDQEPQAEAGARSSDGMAARADGSWRASGAGAAPAGSWIRAAPRRASATCVTSGHSARKTSGRSARTALSRISTAGAGHAATIRSHCARSRRARATTSGRSVRRRRCCTSMGATGGHGACPERPAAIRSPLPRPRQATSGCSRPVS